MKSYNKGIVVWLFTGCILIWAMVIVGGITRLTHSGLSMVKWNITGILPPMTQEAWQEKFADYQQTPEFKQINTSFTVEDYKSIYWWEYIHRTIGKMIGMVFMIPFLYFLYRGWLKGKLLKQSLGIFALGGLQGALGWFMVASGLEDVPHVSHYRLAAHLFTAFITFGFTFWVALDLIYPRSASEERFKSLKKWSNVLLFFVLLQIVYGAFTAGLHAGYFDPTWPKMANYWIAPEVTALTPIWKNFLDGIAGVQFIHRYNAYVVVILVFILWFKTRKMQLLPAQRKGINFLIAMVVVQFLLGVYTLIYSVPVTLGVLHQTGAFLLFASTLYVIHQWSIPAKATN
jgi:cytochrome c oxidase assembly protein subunit 15